MSIIKTWNRNFKTTILFHSLTKQQFKFFKEINNISKNVCAKKTWFLLKKKQKLHLWIKFFTLNFNSKNRNVTHKFYIVIAVTILIVWHHGWLIIDLRKISPKFYNNLLLFTKGSSINAFYSSQLKNDTYKTFSLSFKEHFDIFYL